MISADPVPVGGDSVRILPPQECEMMDHINVEGQGNTFSAYIARPKTSPTSAVVVLQELFGVNADIRKHRDALAKEGFLAVAANLFWRQEPGVDLNVTSEADWQHGLRLYQDYERDAGVKDVEDTVKAVAKLPGCTGIRLSQLPIAMTFGQRTRVMTAGSTQPIEVPLGNEIMIKKIEIERFSVTSSKSFDQVVAALDAVIGHPDIAEFARLSQEARTFVELKSVVENDLSEAGFML